MSPPFYRAVACRLFATASVLVCGLVSLKLYGKFLSPDIYGVVLVASQVISYLPFLDGGFRTTISRNLLAQPDPREQVRMIHFGQVFYSWLSLIIIVAALAAMLGYAQTANARDSGEPLNFFLTLGIVGALTVIGSAQMNLLVGLQAQASVFLLTGWSAWLTMGTLWIALHTGAGVWAFAWASFAGWCGTYPVTLSLLRKKVPGIRIFSFATGAEFWKSFHQTKAAAWACFRSQGSLALLFTVDLVIVGLVCTAREAAIYGVLSRLYGIVRSFLQATCDVAWPLVAQQGTDSRSMTVRLWRINGWIFGSVSGALCLTAIPFFNWYLGAEWAPTGALVALVTARFVITGVCSPAAYFLFGLGQYHSIARHIERELAVAVLLASFLGGRFVPKGVALGMNLGVNGIAAGFLFATVFGTLAPVILAYARAMQLPAGRLIAQVWWRTLVGLGTSLVAASVLLYWMGRGGGIVVVGLLAAAVAIGMALGISLMRWRLAEPPNAPGIKWSDRLNQI